MMLIETFRVESRVYLRQLRRMYLSKRWPWLVAPLVLCGGIAALTGDVRWVLVTLMVLFVVMPMILLMLYLNYALSMEARWSVMEKSVTVTDEGLLLQFTDTRMHDRLIRWQEMSGVEVAAESFLVMLAVRKFTFLMIPFSELEKSGVGVRELAATLTRNIRAAQSR